ncbi:uncharacterized protein LOC132626971 [Lycium barbarum]|uniref:uncharacterized protein LOC132626971 n=1 Tax=Lycium barbarum TaxID=112863 RepID=UPI00293F28FC|nr:uncharacterized protein LOC132626971 [Lycium barbarum]
MYKAKPPFPQRLAKKNDDAKCQNFYVQLKQLTVNFPFLDIVKEMPEFSKFVKDLLTKKRSVQHETVNLTHRVSSIIASTTIQKKGDPWAFTIPYNIGIHAFARALCDNGVSINLMPLAIFKQSGLGTPRPTSMRLQMADRSIKKPVVVIDDVLVQVGKFMLPADFVILDCAEDSDIPIILGRPFLAMGRALMDSENNEIKFRVNDEEVTFQESKGMKLPSAYESISVIDSFDGIDDAVEHKMEEESLGEALTEVLINFDACDMEGYVETINALEGLGSYTYHPRKLDLDLANRTTPPAKTSIVEPPKIELKQFPTHLRYEFLGPNKTLSVIISALLTEEQIEHLVEILREYIRVISWTIADIRGIPSGICAHKIQLEEDSKPSVEHQRRLNQNMQEVVKEEIIKWLDAGVVYPIAVSKWVSPVQCVTKKGGITVVPNAKNELIPARTVTGWRVCMDYRKLNTATFKDHFPMPFIDQMLDRLAGRSYYCFLDGYSGYN